MIDPTPSVQPVRADLAKQLRDWAEHPVGRNPAMAPCAEAADRIEALEAENKALREDAKRIYWAGAKDMRERLAEKVIAFGKSVHTEALPEFPARALLAGEAK